MVDTMNRMTRVTRQLLQRSRPRADRRGDRGVDVGRSGGPDHPGRRPRDHEAASASRSSLETPVGEEEERSSATSSRTRARSRPLDAGEPAAAARADRARARLADGSRAPGARASLRPRGRACPDARGGRQGASASRANAFARSRRTRCGSCATRRAPGSQGLPGAGRGGAAQGPVAPPGLRVAHVTDARWADTG